MSKKTVYLVFDDYRQFPEDWNLGCSKDRERTRVRCANLDTETHSRTYPKKDTGSRMEWD